MANLFVSEFNRQEGPLATLKLAPKRRQGVWRKQDIEPSGIDRMVEKIDRMMKDLNL